MAPKTLGPKLLNWASQIDENTVEQAKRTARLPFIVGHVALMPDAHFGKGSTVGSVIPTKGAIVPAAVGVDLGCGMLASRLTITADRLPDNLDAILPHIEAAVPGGMGKERTWGTAVNVRDALGGFAPGVERWKLEKTAIGQVGTLGGGNHFLEVCVDENDDVWVVLHSGSRGVGNKIATRHIETATKLMKAYFVELDDPDLAYLVEGTDEFKAYITDMLWAQDYAALNRDVMMESTLEVLHRHLGPDFGEVQRIQCHHNFTVREQHFGQSVWVTRKGAIRARKDDLGIIPGSMGASTFIVRGLGNAASLCSCSHGAGRTMSRNQAKKMLTVDTLQKHMEGRTWLTDKAEELLDEHPEAYKPIDQVMADQADLVETVHVLRAVLNFKGTK